MGNSDVVGNSDVWQGDRPILTFPRGVVLAAAGAYRFLILSKLRSRDSSSASFIVLRARPEVRYEVLGQLGQDEPASG